MQSLTLASHGADRLTNIWNIPGWYQLGITSSTCRFFQNPFEDLWTTILPASSSSLICRYIMRRLSREDCMLGGVASNLPCVWQDIRKPCDIPQYPKWGRLCTASQDGNRGWGPSFQGEPYRAIYNLQPNSMTPHKGLMLTGLPSCTNDWNVIHVNIILNLKTLL